MLHEPLRDGGGRQDWGSMIRPGFFNGVRNPPFQNLPMDGFWIFIVPETSLTPRNRCLEQMMDSHPKTSFCQPIVNGQLFFGKGFNYSNRDEACCSSRDVFRSMMVGRIVSV
jgi:hypothetical protein